MVEIKEWDRGETIRIQNTYTDSNSTLYDPDTIELKIYDPKGLLNTTKTFESGEIVKSSTGIYYYDYKIDDEALTGWWISKWTATIGTQTDRESDQFYVRDPEERLYCSVNDVYNRCGMESDVADKNEVINYIRTAMSWIDSHFGKSFNYSNTKTEWFDTDVSDPNLIVNTVFLTYTPIRTIESVEEYDIKGNLFKSYDSDEYWIDKNIGELTLNSGYTFEHQRYRVKIVYTYGFDQVPNKISHLCSIIAGQSVLIKFVGGSYDNVTAYNAAGLSISLGEQYTSASKAYEQLEKEKNKLLADIGRLRMSVVIV